MRGKDKEMLRKAIEDRDRLARQIENLQHQLAGMDRLIAAMQQGARSEQAEGKMAPRERVKNMKETVLGLLAEAPSGLTVGEVMDGAIRRGIHLERNSVSSLLSRLKREGTLSMEDGRYSIKVRALLRHRPESAPVLM